MQRQLRLGYVPISISSKALSAVDREGLKTTLNHAFSTELAVFELSLESELSIGDLQRIYEGLALNRGKRMFKMTPEDYYALHLRRQLALENRQHEHVQYFSLICKFLKTQMVAYIDECRLNMGPFTQAKIGIGKTRSLSGYDRVIYLNIYRAFLNADLLLPNKKSVAETVSLVKNQHVMMKPHEREEVKKAVISYLLNSTLLEIPSQQQSAIFNYLINGVPEPEWDGIQGNPPAKKRDRSD